MARQEPIPGLDRAGASPPRKRGASERGRLRVHDPFELIRWLAMSQPDPRKALAELVQNSLDAGALHVTITRFRKQGTTCLLVRDDGQGVIPELGRSEALHYLATHVGHSRKRSLTPRQRLELMTQGQYGIGLLGFWSLGRTLEMRSMLPGANAYRLVLERDKPDYAVEPLRASKLEAERATEVLVVGLHRAVLPVLSARRIADFLATELRGQLLARDVTVRVVDRIARGRGAKEIAVRPQRFVGQRIEELRRIAVPGHPDLLLDVYLDPAEQAPEPLALYSAGTLVATSFGELQALGLAHAPWTDSRLTGMVDFPVLTVAPGSRRGVVIDAAAHALVVALGQIAPRVQHYLDQEEERRAEELDRTLVRDLQRAFAGIFDSLPRYSLLPVAKEGSGEDAAASAGLPPEQPAAAPVAAPAEVTAAAIPAIDLLPAGPLAQVEITPSVLRLACGASRLVRAHPKDQADRPIDGRCDFLWRLVGVRGEIEAQPPGAASRVRVIAGSDPASGRLRVVATTEQNEAAAEIPVEITADAEGPRGTEGVPEPELVDETGRGWRSRMSDGRWQVNSGHPGFRAVADSPSLKLRYLALLFAKEVVLHDASDPRLEAPLEGMVEVFAYADRRLARNAVGRRAKAGSRQAEPG